MQEKENVTRQLESQNASLDRKCNGLRDYIRKLTLKCEEWAEYAEKQSLVIQKVQRVQQEERRPYVSSTTQADTATPRTVVPEATSQEHEWSVERRMLDRVANLAGEEDLNVLAAELLQFGLK